MTAREDVDRRMRQALLELDMVAGAKAASYEPRSRSGATSSVVLTGGNDPARAGSEADYYRRAYGPPFNRPSFRHPGAVDDHAREQLVKAARETLDKLRGHARPARPAGETTEQRIRRMLVETEGMAPHQVTTTRFCDIAPSARHVRHLRRRNGRDPETGALNPQQPVAMPRLAAELRIRRVQDLRRRGYSVRDAARTLGVSAKTIERDLGKERAA